MSTRVPPSYLQAFLLSEKLTDKDKKLKSIAVLFSRVAKNYSQHYESAREWFFFLLYATNNTTVTTQFLIPIITYHDKSTPLQFSFCLTHPLINFSPRIFLFSPPIATHASSWPNIPTHVPLPALLSPRIHYRLTPLLQPRYLKFLSTQQSS